MQDPQREILASMVVGADRERGNMLGIQPWLRAHDYLTPARLAMALRAYLDLAQRQGWLGPKTVVVFPEHIGTWLVAAHAGPAVVTAATLQQAMARLALTHPLKLLASLPRAKGQDRLADGLFRMAARRMAADYQRLFAELASDYGVTIVAGSIVLPEPHIRSGQLQTGCGPLQSCTALFRPDGRLHDRLTLKAFPPTAELAFSAPSPGNWPVYDTPAGRLGVLICADAFYPASYAALQVQHPDLLAVPSYLEHNDIWEQPWAGYNGAAAPDDVAVGDIGTIREGDAWLRYGMAGRAKAAGIPTALNVFLQGQLWDLGADGPPIVLHEGTVQLGPRVTGASACNIWL